jgi:sugar/nucleoside kinase (ribokinase family)
METAFIAGLLPATHALQGPCGGGAAVLRCPPPSTAGASTRRQRAVGMRARDADAGASADGRAPVPVPTELAALRVVGLGACTVDLHAYVAAFPTPDAKVRTTRPLRARGGGNTANTLTGVRRLGLPCALIAAVGDDDRGHAALDELERDGVDTDAVRVAPGVATPSTYVIVDERTGSRTCIHSPAEEELLRPEHLPDNMLRDILRGASLLHLDGRHTAAAIALATVANDDNDKDDDSRITNSWRVPVLLDVERDRPLISFLVPRADYVVTNSIYPHIFAPDAADTVDAMARILACGRARFVISTAGSVGATLLARLADAPRGRQDPEILVTREVRRLPGLEHLGDLVVLQCPPWPVPKVVDTTGAGDAFIAGVAYGICVGLGLEAMLGLAARLAASNIQKMGARGGLPRRENLPLDLLTALPRF